MLVGAETVLWPRAAKKSGNWYRGVVDATDRFTRTCHRGETGRSWLLHEGVDATSSSEGELKGGGRVVLLQLWTKKHSGAG